MRLTFNAGTTSLNVSVDLRDDNLYEREEDFNGNLTFVSGERVTVSPDNALATILDDEGKQIHTKSIHQKVCRLGCRLKTQPTLPN